MKIEIRNVHFAAFASEETNCFRATVYIDGVKAGDVSNEGHGGPNFYHPHTLETRLMAHADTLPDVATDYPDPHDKNKKFTYRPNADHIIGELFDEWLLERERKRQRAKLLKDLQTRFVYTKKDRKGVWESKKCTAQQLAMPETTVRAAIKDVDQILNFLPPDQAFTIYLTNVETV